MQLFILILSSGLFTFIYRLALTTCIPTINIAPSITVIGLVRIGDIATRVIALDAPDDIFSRLVKHAVRRICRTRCILRLRQLLTSLYYTVLLYIACGCGNC